MAAVAPSSQHVPLREQSHLDLQQSGRDTQADTTALEDRLCPGCKKSAVNNEHGGLVVAFGQSFFHVDCFKCAKCKNQVTADTNLLLLSDGSPICADCSYSCNVCKQPILDEAIMAGEDSYHAHCFKCKVCKNRIDELVFAKTSSGIYCMKCHNERMIRIRKHTQKKAERERAQGGSGGSKSRERTARDYHRENNVPPSPGYDATSHASSKYASSGQSQNDSSRRPSDQTPSRSQTAPDPGHSLGSNGSHSVSVTVAPPPGSSSDRTNPAKQQTLPLPQSERNNFRRSFSYDTTKLPEDSNAKSTNEAAYSLSSDTNSLSVTSRQQKRRSINPGLTLSSPVSEALSSITTPTTTLSPRSDAFNHSNSRSPSPLVDQKTNRTSHANSLSNVHSLSAEHEPSRSPSPSITTHDYDRYGQTPRSPNPGGPHGEKLSAALSPQDPKASFRAQQRAHRSSANSNLSVETHRSGSRSASPSRRADVPHGVESGTDTEPEGEGSGSPSPPPALPPKDKSNATTPLERRTFQENDYFQKDDASDADEGVERIQTSTFIAPALPPIRFSMNPAEFSDLLSSVNKPMANLANLQKQALEASSSPSPPPLLYTPSDDDSQPATPTADSNHTHNSNDSSHLNGSRESKSSKASVLTQDTVTSGSGATSRSSRSPDAVIARLREVLEDAKDRNAQQLKVDRTFMEALLQAFDTKTSEANQVRAKLDGMRRASKQYIEGLTVAQTEYDRELKARRDAEAEVTRLRVLLSGQAARLTALSGDTRRQEVRQQMTKELHDNLSGLEEEMSRLKAERDMTLAEMEELSAARSADGTASESAPASLGRSLTKRLDTIRAQYSRDLIPLQHQREQLSREIAELKAVRDVFLEETAALNARNEELAQLSSVYARRIDTIPEAPPKQPEAPLVPRMPAVDRVRQGTVGPVAPAAPSLSASTSSSSTVYEENGYRNPGPGHETTTPAKKFKWPGQKVKDLVSLPSIPMQNGAGTTNGVEFSKGKAHIEHNFQQLSVLRFARCDHCGDKMWGSQLKCTVCSTSIHVRCIAGVNIPCTSGNIVKEDPGQLPPSMFGRDLREQVHAESNSGEPRRVPIIVEKCIEAVDALALDYEGIYRKTGGSTQTKAITQLFERGDYSSFDLLDTDRFNDICSVTSVLKNYFRSLPNPLLTFELHDQFITSASIRDPAVKHSTLLELVNNLPDEHYYTLRTLMTHLHRIRLRCEKNRMTSRNLGVVFGPTLMRSRDPGAEFSDMAGKALFIEWLIDNAPEVFKDD